MPYILEENRKEVLTTGAVTPGELNYFITYYINHYLKRRRDYNYTDLNEIVGVLESVKQEFYRRVVAPYEEQKRFDNGDRGIPGLHQ